MEEKEYLCRECKGKGEIMVPRLYPNGHTECYEECEFCEGRGAFPEDEFLMLKLEGKVR